MTAYDYTKLAETAARLVERFGRSISLVTITDSGSELEPTQVETVSTVKGVQTDLTDYEPELIQAGDRSYLIASDGITTDMRVRDGSTDYSIEDIKEIKPGDTFMIYKILARK